MQSSLWSLACAIPRKHFDTSGKSPALIHHRAIIRPMTLPGSRLFGAIAGRHPELTIEVAPARHREGSLSRCRAARKACPRRYRREHASRHRRVSGISRNQSGQGCAPLHAGTQTGETLCLIHRIARNDGPRAVDLSEDKCTVIVTPTIQHDRMRQGLQRGTFCGDFRMLWWRQVNAAHGACKARPPSCA